MTRVWRGSDNNQHESGLYRGSGIHNPGVKEARSAQYSAFQHLEAVCRGSLTHQNTPLYTQPWSTELWTQHRDWIIQMSQCLQFEPQWEFNFHNYQAKLDFHWWAVSESWCQVSGGEYHQAGNSPIWDNSRVKITVQIVSNPYFSCAQPTSIAIIKVPPYRGGAGKCVVWSKQ